MVNRAILEEKRKEAFFSGNSQEYYNICNQLGIEPEDQFLYERGEIENQVEQEEIEALLLSHGLNKEEIGKRILLGKYNRDTLSKYDGFYRESQDTRTTEDMRDLLKKYFAKFRPKGKQPVDKMEDSKVFGLFNVMMKAAEKYR